MEQNLNKNQSSQNKADIEAQNKAECEMQITQNVSVNAQNREEFDNNNKCNLVQGEANVDNKNCTQPKDKGIKKQLSPYQKFLQGQDAKYNKYKQSYFEFYDDVKDKTHKIIDW